MVLFFGFGKTTQTFFPTQKHLNILDGALFVVYFLISTLFLLFSSILTCSCISCAYPVALYNVNTPSTPYFLFLTDENVPLTFGFVLWLWKNHAHVFSNFETSKYLRWHLVWCLYPSKYVISAVLWHFNLQFHQLRLSCCGLHCNNSKHSLLFVFND